jgi:iron complex transport system permease protein
MVYTERRSYYRKIFMIGIVLLLIIIIGSTNIGVANISFVQTTKIILSKIPLVNKLILLDNVKESSVIIILKLRLPRIILACLVGAGLSIVGASFQGMFKNPMADPYVLGISSGAALGATLTIVFGIERHVVGISVTALCAFIGAVVTTLTVYNVARVGNKVPSTSLLLSGVAISFLLSSLISLIMTFKREHIERIVMWTMGSVSTASWNQVLVLLPIVVVSTIILYFFSRDLNVFLLGEDNARTMGIEVEKLKKYILLLCTLQVAVAVSVSGIIGFVGLIVPHGVRILTGSDNRIVIPFSALGGAIFLVICDTIARSIVPPIEIPVGIITSIFGVPFFMYLLYKTKKKVF